MQIRSIRSGRKGERGVSGKYLVSNSILHITADPETVPIPHSVQNFNCQKLSTNENPTDSGKRDHPPTVTLKEWPGRRVSESKSNTRF